MLLLSSALRSARPAAAAAAALRQVPLGWKASPLARVTTAPSTRPAFTLASLFDLQKLKVKAASVLLYETVADQLAYTEFFGRFGLPDSLNSWFLVTELHVWMVLVRAMAEPQHAKVIRNSVVEAMWPDVQARAKKLGVTVSSLKQDIFTMYQQFQWALYAYDEGLMSDDTVLSAALWKRFFEGRCDDPEALETLVKYVRLQIYKLDNLDTQSFLYQKDIKWTPLKQLQS